MKISKCFMIISKIIHYIEMIQENFHVIVLFFESDFRST